MLVAARPTLKYVVRCVVSTVLNTALRPRDLWFGWLVHFKVHYQKSQCKMFWVILCAGADPGFQVRGEGAHLKKIAPSRGRRENFWGISCEKSRFYAKKSYFSNFRGGARNFWGISCEKSRFYAKKNHIFTNFRGPPPPPPLNPPLMCISINRFPAKTHHFYLSND